MDDPKIELLRRLYAAYTRGDFDAVTESAHPDITLVRTGGQGEVRGTDAIRAWMEPDAFSAQVQHPEEFEVRANKVLVHARGTFRGAGSGIEMKTGTWIVWTFAEDQRVSGIEIFLEHEEADARRALQAS